MNSLHTFIIIIFTHQDFSDTSAHTKFLMQDLVLAKVNPVKVQHVCAFGKWVMHRQLLKLSTKINVMLTLKKLKCTKSCVQSTIDKVVQKYKDHWGKIVMSELKCKVPALIIS